MAATKLDQNWRNFSCILKKETHSIIKTMAASHEVTMAELVEKMVTFYVNGGKSVTKE